jgi:hypothetical protein
MGAGDFFYTTVEYVRSICNNIGDVFGKFIFRFRHITGGGIRETLRRFNIYRRVREYLNLSYLEKTVTIGKNDILITWQPVIYVLLKVGVAYSVAASAFAFYPGVAAWIKWLIGFFRLNEIYNFEMPGRDVLENIGRIVLVIPIGYAGIWFSWYQLTALFSSFAVNEKGKKAYYIKNVLIKKELFIFSIPEIEHFILKQNIVTRLFGIGTIVLKKKSGETVRIGSLKNVSSVIKKLSSIKSKEASGVL